jgi:tetratricopeptide (TPR) repeat protein
MHDVTRESRAHPTADRSRLERLLWFIVHDPDNLKLRQDAVREACAVQEWPVARGLLDIGLQSHPDDAELLAHAGLVYLQARQYVAAERVLTAALAQGLEPAEVRHNLAFALFLQRRPLDALAHLTPPLMPFELPQMLVLRARCLHHLGRRGEAIADCRAHLVHARDHPQTNGLLALLLYEQEERALAQRHLDAALRRDPTQREALLTLGSIESERDDDAAARATFDKLLATHPDCGRGWLGLALMELRCTQVAAAKRAIELAARYMPEHIGTWHVLAWTELILGNIDAAQAALHRALALDRNFGETHGGLAVVAALQGLRDDARLAIKRALRLDPQSLSARYAEVVLLEGAGRVADARAVFERLLSRQAAGTGSTYRDVAMLQMARLRAASG